MKKLVAIIALLIAPHLVANTQNAATMRETTQQFPERHKCKWEFGSKYTCGPTTVELRGSSRIEITRRWSNGKKTSSSFWGGFPVQIAKNLVITQSNSSRASVIVMSNGKIWEAKTLWSERVQAVESYGKLVAVPNNSSRITVVAFNGEGVSTNSYWGQKVYDSREDYIVVGSIGASRCDKVRFNGRFSSSSVWCSDYDDSRHLISKEQESKSADLNSKVQSFKELHSIND